MQTESFSTPSPNKIANSFGSDSSLIKAKAAIVSVALMTLAKSNNSERKCYYTIITDCVIILFG